ncbi:ATP-binding protein [Catenovulum maritimum]|uniref:ATP-binding protein n=1 Tax=Catenovulum maritimum TaxID=1513271 RepID=UPI00122DF7DF|nr:ATP-binding protein [Catenovulum maritimum]
MKYLAHIEQRARPIVAYVYAIGGIIPLLFLFLAYLKSYEYFVNVAAPRLTYLSIWALITWATFSSRPILSIRNSLVIYTLVGSVFVTYMNSILTQNQLFTVPSVLMFLIGIVIAQVGARVQLYAGIIAFACPLILLQFKQQVLPDDISVVVLIGIWAVISYLASIVLEKVNRKLFQYEQELAHTSRQKQILLEKEAKSNQFKSQFLANMSHEIRTPLTSILGYADTYFDYDSEAEKEKAVSTIKANSQHLLHIVSDILDLSKIEAGKIEIENIKTPIFDFMSVLESNQVNLARSKGLDFFICYQFPMPRFVDVDATKLNQVLLNLTNNAIKFTHSGYVEVKLGYDKQSESLRFEIRDTGIGISESALCNLFNAFTQADNSHSRKYGGTGLGLYISKQIINSLGGDIQVSSEVGKGACFYFSVKASTAKFNDEWVNELPKIETKSVINTNNNSKLSGNVLVADDHDDNRKLIAHKLELLGLTASLVCNGEQAVEKALLYDFDLILMDIQMPVMDGLQAVEMIRLNDADTPIIALTANAMKQDITNYLDNGFNDHLTKPIDAEEFSRVLSKFLPNVENDDEPLFSIDSDEFKTLVADYRSGLPCQLEMLKHAYQSNNWALITKISHSIKGSAGNFGFTKLTNEAAELETHLRAQGIEQREPLYNNLINELQSVISS